jgi:Gas vesicle synthesis protein GvpL/GvpF
VSALYLYALLAAEPTAGGPGAELGAGLAGEPLRLVAAAGLRVACGEVEAPPVATAAALAAHDAVVRRLGAAAAAVLPFRFGQHASDPAALDAALSPRAAELAAALVRVAGCVQMTLRVFGNQAGDQAGDEAGAAAEDETVSGGAEGAGPGTRYLAARRRRERSALALPGVAELRAALRPLVRAERLERHGPGRLLLSVHDLVPAEAAAGYRAEVEAASARRPSGPRVTVSGPWPPYAFGEAALGGEHR